MSDEKKIYYSNVHIVNNQLIIYYLKKKQTKISKVLGGFLFQPFSININDYGKSTYKRKNRETNIEKNNVINYKWIC